MSGRAKDAQAASTSEMVRRPNEKGHVERLLDYARSNFLVPVPEVDSLEELNARLAEQCRRDQGRSVRGKPGTVGLDEY